MTSTRTSTRRRGGAASSLAGAAQKSTGAGGGAAAASAAHGTGGASTPRQRKRESDTLSPQDAMTVLTVALDECKRAGVSVYAVALPPSGSVQILLRIPEAARADMDWSAWPSPAATSRRVGKRK